MQRDPKFIKNKEKFFGAGQTVAIKKSDGKSVASSAKSKLSAAQKLDNYIQF